KDVAEFSYVVTAGNSESRTLGFKDKLGRKWDRSSFELKAGGVRAEATTKTRTAAGTVTDLSIDETSATARIAERYFLKRRYDLILDGNLDDTSDFKANMTNSLAVAMSRRLALKVSLQLLYDHQPAFQAVDLLGAPPPGVKVLAQLDDLDTIFTTSLVVNF